MLKEAVLSYVDSGGKVKPPDYELGQGLVEFSSTLMHSLTNAAEQFVIAHELGHIALGHLGSNTMHAAPVVPPKRNLWQRVSSLLSAGSAKGNSIRVIQKNHLQEHQADLWGYRTLLQRAIAEQESEATVPIAVASAGIFLGVNLLLEAAYRERRIAIPDTHPDGLARLYMAQVLTELEGCHAEAYIARRFYEFLEQVGRDFSSFEMPPLLSRDLNQITIPVMESLHIDLSSARFLHEFI